MKLLIDESLNVELLDACRNAGIDYMCEGYLRGETDKVIIQYSTVYEMPIVTEDKDFGELIYLKGLKPFAVILLRYSPKETIDISIDLYKFLTDNINELKGNFIVITTAQTRVKPI